MTYEKDFSSNLLDAMELECKKKLQPVFGPSKIAVTILKGAMDQ